MTLQSIRWNSSKFLWFPLEVKRLFDTIILNNRLFRGPYDRARRGRHETEADRCGRRGVRRAGLQGGDRARHLSARESEHRRGELLLRRQTGVVHRDGP